MSVAGGGNGGEEENSVVSEPLPTDWQQRPVPSGGEFHEPSVHIVMWHEQ